MSFDTERKRAGRRPMRVVTLALDAGTETFCDLAVPTGEAMWPAIADIDLAPTRLKPGKGIAERGTVRMVLEDWPHPDGSGTYLGRMIAENQFYLDRVMTVQVGYLAATGYDPGDFSDRTYFIESIDGPDESGRVVVTGKDALKGLHDSGSKMPRATKGKLVSAITASTTGLVDIGDVDGMPSTGHIKIEDEYLAYSSISGTSVDVSARGQFGTDAVPHDAGESARWAYGFVDKNVVDLLEEVLPEFANVDASYIPSSEWATERDEYLSGYNLTGIVDEPEQVKEFVKRVSEQCSLNSWWDERNQAIRLRAWGPRVTNAFLLTDEHLLEWDDGRRERLEVKRDLKDRTTQIWYVYDKINHAAGDESGNFDDVYLESDLALEAPAAYGKAAVRVVKAPYVTSSAVAAGVSSRLQIRREHGITKLRFSLDAADADPWTGDIGILETDRIQNTDGTPRPVQIIITSVEEMDGHVYRYEAEVFKHDGPVKYFRIAPSGLPDYTAATAEQKAKYGWFADAGTKKMSNGDDGYYIL